MIPPAHGSNERRRNRQSTFLLEIPAGYKKDTSGWDIDRRIWKVGDCYILVWCSQRGRTQGLAGHDALNAAIQAKFGDKAKEVPPPGH